MLRVLDVDSVDFANLGFPKWKPQNFGKQSSMLRALNVDTFDFSNLGFPKWKPENGRKQSFEASILGTLILRSQHYQH